ncbi:MAG: autotransporter outer membrane beta-barrel domain-containing protein, partial [Candidatus Marinimicrobia bacterium]|nr:autotransporter outer membrane beta-barrel domain-containing protein [Candidatus Neomarinimicrobiota bacterium]
FTLSTDYTILTAAGGLGGTTFASVNSNFAFLTPTLSYDANNVFLNLTRNSTSFGSVSNTPNQSAVANTMDNNTTALEGLVNDLLALTDDAARLAFASLSGAQHTQGQVVINKLGQQFSHLLLNRSSQNPNNTLAFNVSSSFNPMQGQLLAFNGGGGPLFAAPSSATAQDPAASPERGWWVQSLGGFGHIDDTGNVSGADYRSAGFVVGLDTVWRDFIVGVAGSYANSDADTLGGDTDINSFQTAAYGSWQRDALYVNATLGLGYHKTDTTREVVIGTAVSTATANYGSVEVNIGFEAGHDIALSPVIPLTPYFGLEYSHSRRNRFTETGAGTANLSVNGLNEDSLRSKLGLRLSRTVDTQDDRQVTPYMDVAYVHEHLDSVSRMEAGFAALPASTFFIDGSELDRDRLQVGLGITGQLNERTSLNVAYTGEFAGSNDNHGFSAKLEFSW